MLIEDRKNDIIYLLKYLNQLINKHFDKRLAEYGLTGQQGRILFFIANKTKENIEVHQNDIESEFHLSKSTVSGLVKRMEKKGIISTTKKKNYVILKPTDSGLSIICHIRERKNESLSLLTDGLGKEEYDKLCNKIIKLIENMEGGE